MKRTALVLIPLLAFGVAASLGWLSARTDNQSAGAFSNNERITAKGRNSKTSIPVGSAALQQIEHEFLSTPAPPEEIYNAEGMDEALDFDSRTNGFPGGGTSSLRYAYDWAFADPEGMFAWLSSEEGPPLSRKSFFSYILFSNWAEKDLKAALSAATSLPDSEVRGQAVISTLEVLNQKSPERARELLLDNLSLFSTGTTPTVHHHDFGISTCTLLTSLPPSGERTHLLANLLHDISGQGPDLLEYASEVWQGFTPAFRRELIRAGFYPAVYSASTFDGLHDLVLERAESSEDEGLPWRAVETWATRDLPAALDWTQNNYKGKQRVDLSAELFRHAAASNLDDAVARWRDLPDSILKDRAQAALLRGTPRALRAETQAALESE